MLPPLTIRTRLTVSYAVALVLVLLVVAVAVSIVHEGIGMARIDRHLRNHRPDSGRSFQE